MATIIKPDAQLGPSGFALRGVAYSLSDMASQADDYLAQVRRESAKIVETARQEAAAIRAQAEAAGKKAAEAAIDRILDEKVAKQMQTLTPALNAAVAEIQESRSQWLARWEQTAGELAIAIAGRIVRGALNRRPEITLQWLREALDLAAGNGEVTVQLNPADHQALRQQAEELARIVNPLGACRVVAEASITAGGCKVTTEFGQVDMQLETQLARASEELCG